MRTLNNYKYAGHSKLIVIYRYLTDTLGMTKEDFYKIADKMIPEMISKRVAPIPSRPFRRSGRPMSPVGYNYQHEYFYEITTADMDYILPHKDYTRFNDLLVKFAYSVYKPHDCYKDGGLALLLKTADITTIDGTETVEDMARHLRHEIECLQDKKEFGLEIKDEAARELVDEYEKLQLTEDEIAMFGLKKDNRNYIKLICDYKRHIIYNALWS